MRFVLTALMVAAASAALTQNASAQGTTPAGGNSARESTWLLSVGNARLEGMPLLWNKSQVLLLDRSGRLVNLKPSEVREPRQISNSFSSYTVSEMRAQLMREMGNTFDVASTGHFLVAHPKGEGERWARRFEDLYRLFVSYFTVRGVPLRDPQFPLIAVVCHDRAEFIRFATNEGTNVSPGVLGYYSTGSNRVWLYDQTKEVNANWVENAATVVHEATHQTAYNLGLHSRFAIQPRWIVEGLGTMFEARGVCDSRTWPSLNDRINAGRLRDFREYAKRRPAGNMAGIIASDRMFQTAPLDAYAEAWALTFYLVETQPQRYCTLLKQIAARPAFSDYPQAQRIADFQAIFGNDLGLAESHFLRFISQLQN